MNQIKFREFQTITDEEKLENLENKPTPIITKLNIPATSIFLEIVPLVKKELIGLEQYKDLLDIMLMNEYKDELYNILITYNPFLFYEMSKVQIDICDTEEKFKYIKPKIILPNKNDWNCIYKNKCCTDKKYVKNEEWVLNFKVYSGIIVLVEKYNDDKNTILVYKPYKKYLDKVLTKQVKNGEIA